MTTAKRDQKPKLPIFPNRIFTRIKSLVGSYREMKRITGVEISTLESWCVSAPLDQVRALFRLLSVVPTQQRFELIRAATFLFPRLDHEFLSGDRFLAAGLARIASKTNGISLILGDSAYLLTFLATAFANTARANGASLFGIDAHAPDWFIPVEGVEYSVSEVDDELLSKVRSANTVIVNGLWAKLSRAQQLQILKLTESSHLIITGHANDFQADLKTGSSYDSIHIARSASTPVGADEAQHMKIVIETGGCA
jgi:hypothetical protein